MKDKSDRLAVDAASRFLLHVFLLHIVAGWPIPVGGLLRVTPSSV